MKTIDFIRTFADGLMARGDNDNGTKVSIPLVDVMGSVVMPTGAFPGYYLILGKRLQINQYRKRPLIYLAEGEYTTISVLLEKLTDDIKRLKCRTLYAKHDRTNQGASGFFRDVYTYLQRKRLTVSVTQAPSWNDYEYGRALLVEAWKDKAIELPKYVDTVVKKQLGEMRVDTDLSEDELYAFHAMRYILAAVEKYELDIHPIFAKKDHKQTAQLKWAAFGAV